MTQEKEIHATVPEVAEWIHLTAHIKKSQAKILAEVVCGSFDGRITSRWGGFDIAWETDHLNVARIIIEN
jgi:hypothetical protein